MRVQLLFAQLSEGAMAKPGCNRAGCSGMLAAVFSVGALILAVWVLLAFWRLAPARPSFARQAGQPCGACRTDQPGLTPFGRRFKLGGYTLGGGKYRTTPFPSFD